MELFPLGGILTLLVLLPNLLFVFYPPLTGLPGKARAGSKPLQVLTVLERAGQAGSFILPFFYRLPQTAGWILAVPLLMAAALAVYYCGWVRYLVQGRDENLFYRSLLGLPLPMALMPVFYFFMASVWLGSTWLALAALVLGVGHIGVTWLNSARFQPSLR